MSRDGARLISGGCAGSLPYGTTSCTDTSTTPNGSYTYQVSYDNACGFSALTSASTIQDIGYVTPVISGPSPACLPVTLSTGSYATYQWSFNGTPIPGATAQTHIAEQDGLYRVATADANGCSGESADFVVNLTPQPTVLGDAEGCGSLQVSTQAFSTYQWYRNGNPISGAIGQTYTAYLSGAYHVQVTNASTCVGTAPSRSITIHTDPEPTITPSSQEKCPADQAQFSVTATGAGLTYLWRKDGTPIADGGPYAGAGTGTLTISGITASEGGAYDCLVTGGPCQSASPTGTLIVHACNVPAPNAEPAFTQGTGNTVSWASEVEATGYEVQASTDHFATVAQTSGTIAGTSHAFSGLTSGQNYQYQVQGVFPYGRSAWSGEVNSTQDAVAPDSIILSPASGAVLYGPVVTVSGSASDALSGVQKIEVSGDGSNWGTAAGTISWSYDWTLPADGAYTLRTRATDAVGNIEGVHGIPVTVRNRPMPATAVTVSDVPFDGGGILDVAWTLSSDDGAGLNYISGYGVLRANALAGPYQQIGFVPAGQGFYEDTTAGTGVNRYYKVRATTVYDVTPNYTDSEVVGPIAAHDEPPLPVNNLFADLTVACNVQLSWIESPSPDILLYNIYHDGGTGTVDYGTPRGTVSAPGTTWVSSGLSPNTRYVFAVRAKDLAGQEDGLTTVQVSIVTTCGTGISQAEINQPKPGRRIGGDRVTVKGQLIQGMPQTTREVLLQFRAVGAPAWTDMVPASGEANPDPTVPYSIHWDTTVLPNGDYDLRAVATNTAGTSDPAPPYITVSVQNAAAQIMENNTGGDHVATLETYKGSGNLNQTAFERDGNLMGVSIPKGSFPNYIGNMTLQDHDPGTYGMGPFRGVVGHRRGEALVADLTPAGMYRTVSMASGHTTFVSGVDVILYFQDENGDGILDGTDIPVTQLDLFRLDAGSGEWFLENTNRTLDTVNHFLRVTVTRAATYGVFTFPKPAKVENLRVVRSGGDLTLTWTPVTMDEKGNTLAVDHYNVYAGSTPDYFPDLIGQTNRVGYSAVASYTHVGAYGDGTNRYYLVTAVDGLGRESYPK